MILKIIVVSEGAGNSSERVYLTCQHLWAFLETTVLIAKWLVECQGWLGGDYLTYFTYKDSTEYKFVVLGQVAECEDEFQVPGQNKIYKSL